MGFGPLDVVVVVGGLVVWCIEFGFLMGFFLGGRVVRYVNVLFGDGFQYSGLRWFYQFCGFFLVGGVLVVENTMRFFFFFSCFGYAIQSNIYIYIYRERERERGNR